MWHRLVACLIKCCSADISPYIVRDMKLPDFLLFASDAKLVGLLGIALLLLAVFSLIADKRRGKRKKIDAVGFMPWTFVFLGSAISGAGLLMVAFKGLLAG